MTVKESITKMTAEAAEERFKEILSWHPSHRKAYEELGAEGLEALGDETAKELLEFLKEFQP